MAEGADTEHPDAEGPPATSGTPAPASRHRLLRDLRHPKRTQFVVAVLLALVGFGAVTQFRTTESDRSYAGYREQDLIDVLNGLSATTQRAQTDLSRLQKRHDDLQANTVRQKAEVDAATSDVEVLAILAGRVPVTGPGIRVMIAENASEVNVASFITLIQTLRSAGAEAIQVNGDVRLVAQSFIDQGPDGLIVDGTSLTPPFVVEAIGTPKTLAGSIDFLNDAKDQLEKDGANVQVKRLKHLDIEAIHDNRGAAMARH